MYIYIYIYMFMVACNFRGVGHTPQLFACSTRGYGTGYDNYMDFQEPPVRGPLIVSLYVLIQPCLYKHSAKSC